MKFMVPEEYWNKLMWLAHEDHLADHFGMRKTEKRLADYFYWPLMKKDVKRYLNSCKVCQVIGKPNKKISKAPLIPIPSVNEPFREVIIDMVGPLPRTKGGNEYVLTIMDRM